MGCYESFFPPKPCADPQPPYFLTAYEIAVKRGFQGTEEEWLLSLSAYGIAMEHGFEGTEEDWLISLTAFSMAQLAGYTGTPEDWIADLANPVPNLQIGEVVTLEGGTEATASISGSRKNPLLNLGIPRGVSTDDALSRNGGTMKGKIDMDTNRLTGLPAPEADTDAANKSYADTKAVTETYKGTFLSSGWSSSAPYTQAITVEGVLSTDYPFVDIDLSDVSDAVSVIEGWKLVGRCTVSADNNVIAYCYEEAPAVDIPIVFKVVR